MLKFWILFISASLFVAPAAFGLNSAAVEVFAHAFHDKPRIYRAAQCGRNVFELGQLFGNQNIQLLNPEVVFFLYEYRKVTGIPLKATLLPSASRSGAQAWEFHVILVAQDPENFQKTVYDLDWRPRSATIAEYLASMFPDKSGDRYKNIFIRRIPLQDYLELLSGKDATAILRTVGQLRSESPDESLDEYLR